MKQSAPLIKKPRTSKSLEKLTKGETQIEVLTFNENITKDKTSRDTEHEATYAKINIVAFKKSLKHLESNYSATS